jgi:hypothetical protein
MLRMWLKTVTRRDDGDLLPVPTAADRSRLDEVWRGLADLPANTMISPQNRMDLWAIEHQVRASRLSAAELSRATWVLGVATVVLVLATVGQVVVGVLTYLK